MREGDKGGSCRLITVDQALGHLRSGELVAIPTETVYGLGGHGRCFQSLDKIYTLKKRPRSNPLIFHYASLTQVAQDVYLTPVAEKLAREFWPGPLTLILPRRGGSKGTLGVRVPSHPKTLELLEKLKAPIAAPSANPSGKITPVLPSHVARWFPDLPILEGEGGALGLESTILAEREEGICVLRPGHITQRDLERVLGEPVQGAKDPDLMFPGKSLRHYAPEKPVRRNASQFYEGDGILSFGPGFQSLDYPQFSLSLRGDLQEAAYNFFKGLHFLDQAPCERIAITPISRPPSSDPGLWEALENRLIRVCFSADFSS